MSDTTIIAALWLAPVLAALVTAWGVWELRGALREQLVRPGRPTAFLDWCWRLFDRPSERRRAAESAAQVARALRTCEQLIGIAFAYTLVTRPGSTRIIERQTAAMRRAITVWRAEA